MFSLGGGELLLIGLIALMLFGPDKVPQLARTAGKVMREIKKYKDIMDATIREQMYLAEHQLDIEETKSDLDKITQAAKSSYDAIANPGPAVDESGALPLGSTVTSAGPGVVAPTPPPTDAKSVAAPKKATRPSAGGVTEAGAPKRVRPKKPIATDEDEEEGA